MSSTYKKYFDPAQVESDQKDLIISQLKAELFELRRNEKNYEELNAKLNNLEHRYNLLQDEKAMNEREAKNRQEINTRNISNLKHDIDLLRNEYESVCDDTHALKLENNGISDIINSRNIEISRIKGELTEVISENEKVEADRNEIQSIVNQLKDENKENGKKLDDFTNKAMELTEKKGRLEKYLKELEFERAKLEKQNNDLTRQQDNFRVDIKGKNETIRFTENSANDNKKHILALEGDLTNLRKVNERTKNEIQNLQKNQSVEFNKNLESQSYINKLEDILKQRELDINDFKGQHEKLKRDHFGVLNANEDLSHDTEQAVRHMDVLASQNNDLINELERYNELDERIRSMLDRKERVAEVKQKTEGKMRASYYTFNSSLKSPLKKVNQSVKQIEYNSLSSKHYTFFKFDFQPQKKQIH